MGANVLTDLIPTLYQSLDIVSRELVGMIPAVSRNASAEMASLGELIRIPITPAVSAFDIVPAVNSPDTGDQTIGNVQMAITKSRGVPVRWNGEQQAGVKNAGLYDPILGGQIQQAMRALINEIETDLVNVAYQNASRAYGTAGTAPFGVNGDLSDISNLRMILDDNGAPQTDLHAVFGAAAVNNLRGKQGLVLKANEAGTDSFRRTGQISDIPLIGFSLHNSNSIRPVTKGTGASYVTSGSTAVGVNQVALVTGTGTVNAGDIVTFAADANSKYVVNPPGVAAPGTITIGSPGARVAIPTANAMTVGASYTPNLGFHRSAIQLVTRTPKTVLKQDGTPGDSALARETVTDPITGLTFELAAYGQYRQLQYQIGIAWGVAAIKPNNIAILIG